MTISYVSAPNKRTAVSQAFNPVNYEGTTVYMDPYANHTTLLLKGNGTNGVVNNNFQDSSSNSYTITRSGNVTQGSFSPYDTNWSSYINGSSYLNVGSTRFLDASAWTVEMWINTTNTANFVTLCAQYTASGGGFSVRTVLGINSSSGTAAIFQGGTLQSGITNVCDGRWHHVAFVLSSGTVKLYVDGTNEATFSGFSTPTTTTTLFFYDSYNSTSYYTGYASNLRVTNTAVYSANFTVPTTALTAISGTQLLTLQSNRYIDNSTNAYTVAVSGTPSIQSFSPFAPSSAYSTSINGGSGYFDGSGDYLSMTSSPVGSSGTFTIECWLYTPSISTAAWIYTQRQSVSSTRFGLALIPDSTGYHLIVTNGSNPDVASTTDGMKYNAWNHIAAVRDGSNNLKIFINGVLDTTSAGWTYSIEQSAGRIGFLGNSATQYYTGYITDTRITNTAVYSSTFSVPTVPLTAITGTQLLINYSNAGIYDDTMMNVFETVGDTNVSTGTKKYGTGSIYFDGTGDYLLARSNDVFNFGTGDFTVEFWINASASGSYTQAIGTLVSGTEAGTWRIGNRFNSANQIYFARGTGSGFNEFQASVNVNDGNWHHVAVVRYSGTVTIYADGVASASSSITGTCTSTNPLYIGYNGRDNAYVTGYMDDIRITKGIARYTTNFTPPQAELPFFGAVKSYNSDAIDLGGVDFPVFRYNTLLLKGDGTNGTQNNTFLDSSSNNLSITRNGNPTQGTFTPYGNNWSNYFDGSGDYIDVASSASLAPGTGDYMAEAWVMFSSLPSSGGIFPICQNQSNPATGAGTDKFWVGLYNNSGTYELAIGQHSASNRTLVNWTPTTGVWYHLALGRSSGTTLIFINGVSQTVTNPTAHSGISWGQSGFCIAGMATPYYINGYISNFRYVVGSVTYSSGFTPSTAPLTAVTNTKILICQSNRFVDNSSNALTLTRNGDTKVVSFSPFAPTSAYSSSTIGGSGYFDGSGDYLSLASNAALALGSGDFTIECWVYPTSYRGAGNGNIVYSGSTANTPIFYYDGAAGNFTFRNFNTADIVTTSAPPLNAWCHFLVSRSGGTVYLFKNGVLAASASNATSFIQSTFYIGHDVADANYEFAGYISDVRILVGTARYTSTFTPPSAPLTAISNTQLLVNFNNSGILDNVMMNDLETVGNAQISTSVKKYGTGSMYFDGSGDYIRAIAGPVNQFGSGDLTIEFWFYQNSRTAGEYDAVFRINSAGTGYNADMYLTIGAGVSGYALTVSNNARNGWAVLLTPAGGLPALSTWHHMAVVRYGSVWTVYLNGVAVGTASYSGTVNTPTGAFEIGWAGTSDSYWDGYIDDFRVTKGIARYTMNFIPPTATFLTS